MGNSGPGSFVGRPVESARDGRDARWEPHRAARRALILDAAIDLLEESDGRPPHVLQVARRAGLGRAVVYRHFTNRAAVQQAMRGRIYERMLQELAPLMDPSAAVPDLVHDIVRGYVHWAVAHPALHQLVSDSGPFPAEDDPQKDARARMSEEIEVLVEGVVSVLGVDLEHEDRALIYPLVLGLVGQAMAVVRNWIDQRPASPDAEELAEHLARGFWFQLEGHARDRGIDLEANYPVAAPPDPEH